MSEFKAASNYIRAKDALAAIFALVVKKNELKDALDDLARLSATQMLEELAAWREDSAQVPERLTLLTQHGF